MNGSGTMNVRFRFTILDFWCGILVLTPTYIWMGTCARKEIGNGWIEPLVMICCQGISIVAIGTVTHSERFYRKGDIARAILVSVAGAISGFFLYLFVMFIFVLFGGLGIG